MSRKRLSFSLAAMLMGGTALAEVPDVAVDIAPVHSLVAQVMAGVGTPDLILPPGATPHEYSLRPSEAAALQQADIVVWMGKDLAPWMSDAVATLAEQATVLTLLEAEETSLLDVRQNALFEQHDHAHGDHDDHGHDEKSEASHSHDHDHVDAEKEHAEGHDHDDDGHGHDDHDAGHSHGASDAHAWLSPNNAAAWLNLIAADLSAADPENAETYQANAAQARAALRDLSTEVNAILEPVRGRSFIVFHDAYQYFENDFDFPASGAISVSDAADPSPARIAEIQDRVRDQGIDCVLAEPQFNEGLVTTVLDGTDARTGVIDPIGIDLDPGPALYAQLIRNMAKTLAGCL